MHEISSWPPSLSSGGLLHTCAKSVLLKCLLDPTTSNFDDEPVSPIVYDFIVFDGDYRILRWRLSYPYSDSESNKGETFSKYFEKVFFPRIVHGIGLARRLDIVWDRYNPMSVKDISCIKNNDHDNKNIF